MQIVLRSGVHFHDRAWSQICCLFLRIAGELSCDPFENTCGDFVNKGFIER